MAGPATTRRDEMHNLVLFFFFLTVCPPFLRFDGHFVVVVVVAYRVTTAMRGYSLPFMLLLTRECPFVV